MRFTHFLAQWCLSKFGAKFTAEQLCAVAKANGFGLDLVDQADWPLVQAHGIPMLSVLPDMRPHAPFEIGFNDPKHANFVHKVLWKALDDAHAAGIKFILVFTGNDSKKEGRLEQYERIVRGFNNRRNGRTESLVAKAERLGVTFVIEMLNDVGDPDSWEGHPGYLGTDIDELAEHVVKPIGSRSMKLAFDAYHLAMMDQPIHVLLREHAPLIGLVHVAGKEEGQGNRGELTTERQEIDYVELAAAMARILPPGTPVLYEYIPTTMSEGTTVSNLVAARNVLESKAPALV